MCSPAYATKLAPETNYVVDRVARLFKRYWGYYKVIPPTEVSKHLDDLDVAAGVDTSWEDGHVCSGKWACAGDHRKARQVGARVALHEKIAWGDVIALPQPVVNIPYFWLGRDAEIHAY